MMWGYQAFRAYEIARERTREADRHRLARLALAGRVGRGPRLAALRRNGARVAAEVARRLDECVARQALEAPARRERRTVAG